MGEIFARQRQLTPPSPQLQPPEETKKYGNAGSNSGCRRCAEFGGPDNNWISVIGRKRERKWWYSSFTRSSDDQFVSVAMSFRVFEDDVDEATLKEEGRNGGKSGVEEVGDGDEDEDDDNSVNGQDNKADEYEQEWEYE